MDEQIKAGDIVVIKGTKKGSPVYDEGRVICIRNVGAVAVVAWNKSGITYPESTDALEKIGSE